MHINITVELHSFLGHPYRPEMDEFINISKKSGMNLARTGDKRRQALEQYLRTIGMTLAEFEALERKANDPWYLDESGRVEIPKISTTSMMVAACYKSRQAMRPCPPDSVRTLLRPTAWTTANTPDDARIWERFAVVTLGSGAKGSNQRGLRRNAYIGDQPPEGEPAKQVIATGAYDINPDMVRPETLANCLSWAGEWVGIGASRKMGWGRFTLLSFEPEESK